MSGFRRFFQAERIKWRKDWTLLTILLVPFTQAGFLLLIVWFSENRVTQFGAGFIVWYKINYIVWNLMFMPVTVALVSALSWDLEERSRAWNHLLVQPVSRITHYFVKLASHLALLLISQLLLAVLLVLGGLLLRAYVPALAMGPMQPSLLLHFAWFSLLAALPVIGLHAWLPTRFSGLGINLAVALGGSWCTFQLVGRWALVHLIPWGLSSQITDITLRAKLPSLGMYAGSLISAMLLMALGTLDFKLRTEARN